MTLAEAAYALRTAEAEVDRLTKLRKPWEARLEVLRQAHMAAQARANDAKIQLLNVAMQEEK